MAIGDSTDPYIQLDISNIESGVIALEELGSSAQRAGNQAVEAFENVSVDALVTAITEVTQVIKNLSYAIQAQTDISTIYEEAALGISALSLACDLFTGEKVRQFIVDEARGLKEVTVELAKSTAGWAKNTAATWLQNAAMTAWKGISAVATTVTTALGAAMNFLMTPIGAVVIGITALIAVIILLITNWETVQAWLIAGWEAIKGAFSAVAEWFDVNVIQPVVGAFAGLWTNIVGFASDAWAGIQSVFGAAGDIFNDIVGGVADFFIGVVNGLIDGINAVVAVPFNGINWALGIVRDIEIMGLSPFEGLKLIDVPQIPHLAQGAVLPANRPFLAMVGDQKHGTNVEAPLETIQEAVALVMGDVVASNMAGHEATVGVLREILGAVMGIEIGDEVIGRAARRYDARMAVVRGGR